MSTIKMQVYTGGASMGGWADIVNDIDGLGEIEIEFERLDGNRPQRSWSSTLTIYPPKDNNAAGLDLYRDVQDKFINYTRSGDTIAFRLIDSCCDTQIYNGVFRMRDTEWCDHECGIKIKAAEDSEDMKHYNCLKRTLISDDYFNSLSEGFRDSSLLRYGRHAKVPYSYTGTSLRDRVAVGVLIADYIENVCRKCGITWQSSIFKDTQLNGWTGDDYQDTIYNDNPYRDSVLVYQPAIEGWKKGDRNIAYKQLENELTLNGAEFLDRLKPLFNAEWRIKDGVLRFERKDYFPYTGNVWKDLRGAKTCYEYIDQELPSYFKGEYPLSGYNEDSNLLKAQRYDDIVEWFFSDEIQKDYLGVIPQFEAAMNVRDSANSFGRFLGGILSGGSLNKEYLYLHKHLTNLPVILSMPRNVNTRMSNALVRRESGSFVNESYNYPYFFNENSFNGLYNNFHFIERPVIAGNTPENINGNKSKNVLKGWKFDSEIEFSCEDFASFLLDDKVTLTNGNGTVNNVQFNFGNRIVKVSGII